jgi:hypothetical protein
LANRELQNANGQNAHGILASRSYHRYSGLNLKALSDYGSIEFRQLPTTLNPATIFTWINIIFSLKRAAENATESNRHILLREAFRTGGPKDLATHVFGSWASELCNYPEFEWEIRHLGLPNAITFMHEVDRVRLNERDPVPTEGWETPSPSDGASHAGYRAWLKASFPKDQDITKKEKVPPINKDLYWDVGPVFNIREDF